MATAEQKAARDAAKDAAAQAVVADRARAESRARGSLAGINLRAAGNLSRYNIGYSDDPNAQKPPGAPPGGPGGGGGGGGGGGTKPPATKPRTRPAPSVAKGTAPQLNRDIPAVKLPPSDGRRPTYQPRLYETNPGSERLGSREGAVPLNVPPAARTAAAMGRGNGTIYEGRGDPLTGGKLSDLQAQRRAVMGGTKPKSTPTSTAAAKGMAAGTLYEGRLAAQTGLKKATATKAAKAKAAANAKALKTKKATSARTTAAAKGRKGGTMYEGKGARGTGATVKQNKAAVAKKPTATKAARSNTARKV